MNAGLVFFCLSYPLTLIAAFALGYHRGWRRNFPILSAQAEQLARTITREKENTHDHD